MYKIKKLANGLEIMTAPIPGAKTVTVLIMVATGSKFESKAKSGLSHFLEHLFFKGTVKRPTTLAISSELDQAGGEYNAFTGKEYTGYFVKVAAEKLALALDVLSDMLINSKFAAEEIEREKGVIIEELNMYLDNPLIYIEDLFEACLYGDTPAGRDTIGAKATISGFKRPAVLSYFGSQYQPGKMIVCLAGRVSGRSVSLAEKYFSKLAGASASRRTADSYQDKVRVHDTQSGPKIKLHFKKTDQAHLSLGLRTVPYAHPDELIVKVIALLLGGSMSSRLFTELRERRGLAYYVRTHDEPYTDSGYLTTQAGVPIGQLGLAIKIILNQYKRLIGEPVGAEELNRVRECLIGRGALQLESSEAVANWYARQIILAKEQNRPGRILTPEKYFEKIKQIGAPEISRAAKKLFKSRHLNLAVIGPYRQEAEFRKMLEL